MLVDLRIGCGPLPEIKRAYDALLASVPGIAYQTLWVMMQGELANIRYVGEAGALEDLIKHAALHLGEFADCRPNE